jgi:hypothetical protein
MISREAREDTRTLDAVEWGGLRLRSGDHVRLRPRRMADIFDLALAGRTATVVAIEEDRENRIYLAVTVDDDPGRDLGQEGRPAHRFFFGIEEVEPVTAEHAGPE